jgi:hypothetical protein
MISQSEVATSNPDFSTGTKARQPQSEPFLTEICLPLFRCYSAVVESNVSGHLSGVFTLLYLDATPVRSLGTTSGGYIVGHLV